MQSSFEQLIKELPPEYDREINMHGACLDHTFVVLDDDPTGCQTVHDVPVSFRWDQGTLIHYLSGKSRMLFILVNTRSLPEKEAVTVISEVMHNLRAASVATGRAFVVISRSDSTLRGHYPAEVDAIEQQFGGEKYMHCLVPAFFPGGRYTLNDIHYVREGDRMIPAAETPFAADKVFGYHNSHLARYVEEKTGGRVSARQVLSFSVPEMREKGPAFVKEKLMKSNAPVCVVNAMAQSDLDVFAAGAWEAVMEGKRMIFRTGASFLNSMGCIPVKEPLDHKQLRSSTGKGGLIIVGSHVPKTSAQMAPLLASPAIVSIELPVQQVLTSAREKIIHDLVGRIEQLIDDGKHVMVYTSREPLHAATFSKDSEAWQKRKSGSSMSTDALTYQDRSSGGTDEPVYQDNASRLTDERTDREGALRLTDLQIGQQVSGAIVELVSAIKTTPSFIIAKGGITSHDIASKGLGIDRSTVIGQAMPGVPVLLPDDRPDLKYIIFPGNVGGEDALMTLFMKLTKS